MRFPSAITIAVTAAMFMSLSASHAGTLSTVPSLGQHHGGGIEKVKRICFYKFIYARKRFGRCPPGYTQLTGIAGNRCARRARVCGEAPQCGTGVC